MRINLLLMAILLSMAACSRKEEAALLVINARVCTVDSAFTTAEAFAVKEGRFIAVGSNEEILNAYRSDSIVDAGGAFIYPGFIDAHCHFSHYGLSLMNADLRGTRSFGEVLSRLQSHDSTHHPEMIRGRGWDQNDWAIKEFPVNNELNKMFPDRPVILTRIDGHAALVNDYLLQLAGITAETKVDGGRVICANGRPTGVLVDNAILLADSLLPEENEAGLRKAFLAAQDACFALGLTTVADAGLDHRQIDLIARMQKKGELSMRVYAMLNPNQKNYEEYLYKGIFSTESLNVRSVKLYADGALGSRGACLLEPYSDEAGQYGLIVEPEEKLKEICLRAYNYGYQVCTHAIGDSANRMMLRIYADILGGKNDLRWRIEHAQLIHPDDFKYFAEYNIIPSVQPTHATSDMGWAEDRVGKERIRFAYAYRKLQEQNGWLAAGTDFPIELPDPLHTFFAAVFRTDHNMKPEGGWQAENALSREDALRSMTIWAARSCFEEGLKGSIEKGKLADFVILNVDLMEAKPSEILNSRVLMTYIGGMRVH